MQREAGGKKTDECGGSSKIKKALYKFICQDVAKHLDDKIAVEKIMFPTCRKKGVILRDEDAADLMINEPQEKDQGDTKDTEDTKSAFLQEDTDDADEDELSRSLGKFAGLFPSHQYTVLQSKATLALTSAYSPKII